MFVLNPQLLLIGVHGVAHTLLTLASATLAGFAFISVNQAWLLVRSTTSERLVLLVAVFMLFHPGLFMDPLVAPYRPLQGDAAEAALVAAPKGAQMRVFFSGSTLEGDAVERGVLLPLGAVAGDAPSRLAHSGIQAERSAEGFQIRSVTFGSHAAKVGIEQGFRIDAVEVPSERLPKEWMFLPAVALIAWVVRRQWRRRSAQAHAGTA
jgi:hypothetical protein